VEEARRIPVTEQPNGHFLLHFAEGDRRIVAWREHPMPTLRPVAVEGRRYANQWQPDMVQVSYVIYQREDGGEVCGPYIGKCLALLSPSDDV
jgi:hypothetical protein